MEESRLYWVRVKKRITLDKSKVEQMTIEMQQQITDANAEQLASNDLLKMTVQTPHDARSAETFWKSVMTPPKPKARKPVVIEEVKETTALDDAKELSTKTLKAATEARKSAVSIDGLEYSDRLPERLYEFANKMESTFKQLQQKIRNGDEVYPELKGIQEELDWFEERRKVAKGMEKQANVGGSAGSSTGAKGKRKK